VLLSLLAILRRGHIATDCYHRVPSDLERHLEMRKPFLEGH
jgi:hypothetical protein